MDVRRIDTFELWCWRGLLRVFWTARRSNQSILKEINPEYSLEGLMLKLQYFGHLMGKADSLEKTNAGKDWRQEEKGKTEDEMVGWHHWLNGHGSEQALGDGEGKGSLACCNPWDCKKSDTTERKNNWTTASHCKKESESSWKREKPYGCLINSTISYISQRIRSICSNKR